MQADSTTEEQRLARNQSHSSGSNSIAKGDPAADHPDTKLEDPEKAQDNHTEEKHVEEEEVSGLTKLYRNYRPVFLAALALVILGWWVSSTVLQATRHRWCVFSLSSDAPPAIVGRCDGFFSHR